MKKKSAFLIYCEEHRDQLKKENPDLSFGEIAKLLGEKWKQLSEDEKEIYNQLFEDWKLLQEKINT
jgi:hypothetical protein